jgi:hypothetical protein
MTGRDRTLAAALFLLGILGIVGLLVFAGNACPTETELQACPDAGRNRAIALLVAAAGVGFIVAPFAFMAEVLARRRIVYRGAWGRAARRGIIAGLVLAAFAGLRLGGVLGVPTGLFVLVLAGAVEWFFVRNDR